MTDVVRCPACGEIKPYSEYYKNKTRPRGIHSACKSCMKIARQQYLSNPTNYAKVRATSKRTYLNNRDRYIKDAVARNRRRLDTNCNAKIAHYLRSLVHTMLSRKDITKDGKTTEYIGCTVVEFRLYFEALFKEGMTWGNHGNGPGKWNIDHIKPIAAFDFENNPDEVFKVNHYTNLQPLWWEDNMKKSDKWEE